MLVSMGLRTLKVPSGALTDLPYLRAVGCIGCFASSCRRAWPRSTRWLTRFACSKNRVRRLGQNHAAAVHDRVPRAARRREPPRDDARSAPRFEVATGYSDHTQGIAVPIAAAALGAIRDREAPHARPHASRTGPRREPGAGEFAAMVTAIRDVERALGDGVKRPGSGRTRERGAARKSIVAARRISAGEPFSEANLTTKRPGTGISPMRWTRSSAPSRARDFEAGRVDRAMSYTHRGRHG